MFTEIIRLDHLARVWVVMHRPGVFDLPMWLLSVVGRGGLVWLTTGLALTFTHRLRPRHLARLALVIALASFGAEHARSLVGRERPFAATPAIEVIGGRPHDSSLPSGHAANAFAGAWELSRLVPSARVTWWALALAIAYSRVYLGVHYPLDVIAGGVVGVLCAAMVDGIASWWRRRHPLAR